MFYDNSKCMICGKCASVCPTNSQVFDNGIHTFNRSTCAACGACANMCMAKAIDKAGTTFTVDEVLKEVLKDKMFYDNSGGGITISGGEPMQQFDFSHELLKTSKNAGLHTCMETCGFAKSENYQKIAQHTDIFLFDYKETDPSKHKEFTGVTNELILKNLYMLDSLGSKIVLRCPIIPGYNDRTEHLKAIGALAEELEHVLKVDVEPYHPLGKSKSEGLGKAYPLADLTFPEEDTVSGWIDCIASVTSKPVGKA